MYWTGISGVLDTSETPQLISGTEDTIFLQIFGEVAGPSKENLETNSWKGLGLLGGVGPWLPIVASQ